eukprot:5683508-Amphidinium_carterae.3
MSLSMVDLDGDTSDQDGIDDATCSATMCDVNVCHVTPTNLPNWAFPIFRPVRSHRSPCQSSWAVLGIEPTNYSWLKISCPVNSKSTTGVKCQLCSAPIAHYSTNQATVAQSSVEAELYAFTSAANNLTHHLHSVMVEA